MRSVPASCIERMYLHADSKCLYSTKQLFVQRSPNLEYPPLSLHLDPNETSNDLLSHQLSRLRQADKDGHQT